MKAKIECVEITSEEIAVDKSIELWTLLSEEDGITKKSLNKNIENKWQAGCPLCEWFRNFERRKGCVECPLGKDTLCGFSDLKSAYYHWYNFGGEKKYAKKILKALINYKEKKRKKMYADAVKKVKENRKQKK